MLETENAGTQSMSWFHRRQTKIVLAFDALKGKHAELDVRMTSKIPLLSLSFSTITIMDKSPEIKPKEVIETLDGMLQDSEDARSCSCIETNRMLATSVAVREFRKLPGESQEDQVVTGTRVMDDSEVFREDRGYPETSPDELLERFRGAQRIGASLKNAGMPTLASDYQLKAIALAKDLEKRGICSFDFEDHFTLETSYIDILISCENYKNFEEVYKEEALGRLNDLAANMPELHTQTDKTVHCRIWKKMQELYFELGEAGSSIPYLQNLRDYYLAQEPRDSSDIYDTSELLCQAYDSKEEFENSDAARKIASTILGDDYNERLVALEAAVEWCKENNFTVKISDQHLQYEDPKTRSSGSPLHEAARKKEMDTKILRSLMQCEHLMAEDLQGDTALLVAVGESNVEVAKELLSVPCLVHVRDEQGQTPLHRCQRSEIMDLLIKATKRRGSVASILPSETIDVNSRDMYEKTVLHVACSRGDVAVINTLLENGADVDAVCRFRQTPLIIACSTESTGIRRTAREAMIHLLLQHGADTTKRDHSERDAGAALRRLGFTKKEISRLLPGSG